jgi:hypothetical protein
VNASAFTTAIADGETTNTGGFDASSAPVTHIGGGGVGGPTTKVPRSLQQNPLLDASFYRDLSSERVPRPLLKDVEAELDRRQRHLGSLDAQVLRLREMIRLRQESNMRREEALRNELERLDAVAQMAAPDLSAAVENLRAMSEKIIEGADILQETLKSRAVSERLALVRSYRVRHRELLGQIERQVNENNRGAQSWIERHATLSAQLDETRRQESTLVGESASLRAAVRYMRSQTGANAVKGADYIQRIARLKGENRRMEDEVRQVEAQLREARAAQAEMIRRSEAADMVSLGVGMAGALNRTGTRPNVTWDANKSAGGASHGRRSVNGSIVSGGKGDAPTARAHSRLFLTSMSRLSAATPNPGGRGGGKQHAGEVDPLLQALTVAHAQMTYVRPQSAPGVGATNAYGGRVNTAIDPGRAEFALQKMRAVVLQLKGRTTEYNDAFLAALGERAELELFVHQCIDDVRRDLFRIASGSTASVSEISQVAERAGAPPLNQHEIEEWRATSQAVLHGAFNTKHRARLVEVLQAKLRILQVLQRQMFAHDLVQFGECVRGTDEGVDGTGHRSMSGATRAYGAAAGTTASAVSPFAMAAIAERVQREGVSDVVRQMVRRADETLALASGDKVPQFPPLTKRPPSSNGGALVQQANADSSAATFDADGGSGAAALMEMDHSSTLDRTTADHSAVGAHSGGDAGVDALWQRWQKWTDTDV